MEVDDSTVNHEGIKQYYISKIEDLQLVNTEKTQNLRRLEAQRNELNTSFGDFNLPGWDWNNRSLKPNTTYPHLHYFFGNSLDDTCLTQIVDVPTRKDNILDLIITNLPNQVQRVEVIPGLSDHDIVFAEFAIASSKLKQKPRIIPLYKKANWSTIKQK
ncbi:PSMC5 [Mytilus edulis]|uniref:PSMC5 n=1 Tax=Mytilus edulis TaxID=6550 RepID=A0A8S3TL31_MYTED|nr:PSMC5 [Mytilus edulis]